MKDTRVAKRYAAALFGVAVRDQILDSVSADLTLVERFVAEVPYLRAMLMQPLVSEERKGRVIGEAFGDRVTGTTLSFLRLLFRKRRENLLDECIRDFRRLVAERNNTVDAVATAAVPLTADQQQRLAAGLQTLTGKSVKLTAQVDPAVLGGLVVRVGDTVIDGSVRTRLESLERHLLGTRSLGGEA